MKKQIKTLAVRFLKAENQLKKTKILNQVEKLLKDYNYKSYNRTKNDFGFSYFAGLNSSSKVVKGKIENYNTLILYLSPSTQSGFDLCKASCLGCELACLDGSGRSRLQNNLKIEAKTITISRLIKSWIYVFRNDICSNLLEHEISKYSKKFKDRLAVRLNGTSDENFYDIINKFPKVQFYDYTKMTNRFKLDNYHLTFSYSENTKARIAHYKRALTRNINLAFPVRVEDYEECLKLSNTYDMDKTDLRFLDKKGYGILKAKVTDNMQCGIDKQFILSIDELKQVINSIEG